MARRVASNMASAMLLLRCGPKRVGGLVLAIGVAIGLLGGARASMADVGGCVRYEVDLSNPTEAKEKATWPDPGKGSIAGWIQTKPIALDSAWRPPSGVFVRVVAQPSPPGPQAGHVSEPLVDVYVRYSPDLKHWSSWQMLQRSDLQPGDEKGSRCYSTTVQVPYRERAEYERLVFEHTQQANKTDEAAALQWILKRDPDFLAKQTPFIAYAEFLLETPFDQGHPIRSLKAEISYTVGGLCLPWDD